MLLGVGVVAPRPDFSWLDPDYADFATQAGQFIPSLIGAGLVVLAIGLSHRVNLAWGATILLLVAGAAFAAAQGGAAVDRRRPGPDDAADRPASAPASTAMPACSPARWSRPPRCTCCRLVVCLLALAGFRQHVRALPNNAWWRSCCRPTCPTRCASASP